MAGTSTLAAPARQLTRLTSMPSSVIRRYSYDPGRRELLIEFTTSRLYVYFDVPESEVARFRAATSKGRYFNLHIRDRYRFRELESS